MKKIITKSSIVALTVLILFASCGKEKTKLTTDEETVFSVRTEKAIVQDLRTYIDTNGNVEAAKQIEAFPDMNGKLVSLNVSLGSRVRKGQIIAEVDPSVPGATFARSPVYAPISGALASVPLQIGTTVTISTPIATIGDTEDLQISSHIPERYIGLLKTGLNATLTVEAYPKEQFSATVVRVSPVVDAVSRTKQIHFELDKPEPRINAGMYAKIRLYTQTISNAITVPSSCIIAGFEEKYIFVINSDDTATKRTVTLGETSGGTTQIMDGISDGDLVVIQGQQVLTDGVRVKQVAAKQTAGK